MTILSRRDKLLLWLLLSISCMLCHATALVPFREMKFTSEPSDTAVIEGSEVMLPCSATYDGRSPSVYSWKRNNALLQPWSQHSVAENWFPLANGSLLFSSVTSSGRSRDTGFYQCIAEEVTDSDKAYRIATPQVELSLATLPSILSEPQDLLLLQGETAMFRCHTQSKSPVSYSWTHNSVNITSSRRVLLHSDGEVLEVRSLNSSDVGQYRCQVANMVGHVLSSSASLVLASRSAQDATTLPSQHTIEPESAGVGGDNSSSVWSSLFGFFGLGGEKSSNRKSTAAPPVHLASTVTTFPYHLIANFTLQNVGGASDGVSLSSASPPTPQSRGLSLDVIQSNIGVDFVTKPWDTSVTVGSDVTLFCAVNGTDSNRNLPVVTWLKSGSTVDTSGGKFSIVGSASLRILNATLDDEGTYTCRGKNLDADSDAAARLSVKVPPYFVTVPSNVYGRVNEDIVLQCEVGGVPTPNVVWLKDSDEVKPSEYFKYVGHDLKILGLMPTDAAYYQCMASNELGHIYAIAQLIIVEPDTEMGQGVESYTSAPTATVLMDSSAKPPAPYNLRAEIILQSYVTLTWSVDVPAGSAPVTKYTVYTRQHLDNRVRAVNTTYQDHTVDGLVPNTRYVFSVRSINRNGYSREVAELTLTTQMELPIPGSVRNLRAWAISEETISVTWVAPVVMNGQLRGYRIYFNNLFMQSNATSVTLNDLHPYTEYYIRVVACNANGIGTHDEEPVVRTFSAKPSAAPRNVTFDVSGATSITLYWTPPPEVDMNGIITGYKIRYKRNWRRNKATAQITDADARSYEITGLEAESTYMVKISALNINGSGDAIPWQEVTTYAAAVQLDETRPPAKPAYIQLKPFAHEMIVSWGATEDADEVLVRGFRIGYGIGIPEDQWIEDIPPTVRIYSLDKLTPQKNYVVQVMAFNHAGVGANAQQLAVTTESLGRDSELNPPVAVHARVISSTSVVLSWFDRDLGQNQRPLDGRIYTVKYDALSGSAQRKTEFKNTTDLFLSLDGLRAYTKYGFSVMISKGNRISFFSLTVRNTTYEAQPSTPPRDLTVTLIENRPNMLMISWQPPSTPNGKIVTYTIYSNTNYQQPLDSWIVEDVEGDKLNHVFGPVTPSTLYFFKMAAHNSKGASPPSVTATLRTPKEFGLLGFDPDNKGAQNLLDSSVFCTVSPTNKPSHMGPSPMTMWIIIACVSTITIIAIAALVVVLCRRKLLSDKSKPSNLKATNQAPKGMSKNNRQNAPNLWINHEQVEMKALRKEIESPDVIDENTSMLHSHGSSFDITDGYTQMDPEPRYCTLGRQRPVIVAPYQQRDDGSYYDTNPYSTMPRATVVPLSMENGRPLYPRTQFATHHPGTVPTVYVGDTSRPLTETSSFCTDPLTGITGVATIMNATSTNEQLESHNHVTSTPYYNKPYMINGEELPPPRPPPMESRTQPLRFKNTNSSGHTIPKHIVKPQPMSFKPVVSPLNGQEPVDDDSLKRPPRPPYANRQLSQGSLTTDSLKLTLKTGSTEQLNTDMANLDNIMQDLSSIKHDFQIVS